MSEAAVTERAGPWLTVFIDAIREARGPRAETVARVHDLRATLMAAIRR